MKTRITILLLAATFAVTLTGCGHTPYDPTKPVAIQSFEVSESGSESEGVLPFGNPKDPKSAPTGGMPGRAYERTEKGAVIGSPHGPIIVRGSKPAPAETRRPVFPNPWANPQHYQGPPQSELTASPTCTKDKHRCGNPAVCKVKLGITWLQTGHRLPGDDLQPHEVPDRPQTNHEELLDLRDVTGYYHHKNRGSSMDASRTWNQFGPDDRFNGRAWDEETKSWTKLPQHGHGHGQVSYTTAPSYGTSYGDSRGHQPAYPVWSRTTLR